MGSLNKGAKAAIISVLFAAGLAALFLSGSAVIPAFLFVIAWAVTLAIVTGGSRSSDKELYQYLLSFKDLIENKRNRLEPMHDYHPEAHTVENAINDCVESFVQKNPGEHESHRRSGPSC